MGIELRCLRTATSCSAVTTVTAVITALAAASAARPPRLRAGPESAARCAAADVWRAM